MDIERLFESLPEIQTISNEQRQLLDRLMALENPVDFDDEFATDEELDALEDALDQSEREAPHHIQLKNHILRIRARPMSSDSDFI